MRVLVRQVVVYTKEGCHLCENVVASLQRMRERIGLQIVTRDITEDSELFERFKNIIPVVEVDGQVRLAGAALSNPRTLDATLERALVAG